MSNRWSDDKLEDFYNDFQDHLKAEFADRQQQQEMYDALFRKGDKSSNVAPGIVQLMVQTADSVETLRIAADRQKHFIGGTLAAIGAVWFFVSDVGPMIINWIKRST